MRKPKPQGNWKVHSADKCGICAKPKRYKKRQMLKEKVKESLEEITNTVE